MELEAALRARLHVHLLEQGFHLRLRQPEALEQEVGQARDRELGRDLRRLLAAREDRLAQALAQLGLALLRRSDLHEGFDRDAATMAIANGAGGAEVDADLQDAVDADVSGVPLHVLGGKFAIPGAQPVDVLKQLIERAQVRLAELESIS